METVRMMEFTPEQMGVIRAACTNLTQQLGASMEARKKLSILLHDHTSSCRVAERLVSSRIHDDFELLDLEKKLQASLQQQYWVAVNAANLFYGTIVTPLQFAKAAVHAYPRFPCPLGLIQTAVHMFDEDKKARLKQ
jgi:hypothetical protein